MYHLLLIHRLGDGRAEVSRYPAAKALRKSDKAKCQKPRSKLKGHSNLVCHRAPPGSKKPTTKLCVKWPHPTQCTLIGLKGIFRVASIGGGGACGPACGAPVRPRQAGATPPLPRARCALPERATQMRSVSQLITNRIIARRHRRF